MSKASATGQITVTSNGTVYQALLQCNVGDLFQSYDGEADNPTTIMPSVKGNKLVLQVFSAESGTGGVAVDNANVNWYIGTTKIAFGSDGRSTTAFGGETGHFTKTVTAVDGTNQPALVMNKELVNVNGGLSFIIKAEVTISVTNSALTLTAAYPVQIYKGVANSKKVRIVAGDTKFFTITEKGGSCVLKAEVISGGGVNAGGYTYKWYIQSDSTTWTQLSDTGATLTVSESQVNSSAMVKVEAYLSGELYGQDIQTVTDSSDPYMITPNPCSNSAGTSPVAENFLQGSGDTIYYVPILHKRDGGIATKVPGQNFTMKLMDNAGVTIQDFPTGAKSFAVQEATVSAHGGACYIIQTTE